MAILALLLAVTPPHSGQAVARTGPELSDLALFATAAGGLWFAQSRLKRRRRKAPPAKD